MNYRNINASEFAELKDQENHVVLDVRSPGELAEGAIAGHIMINIFDPAFASKVAELDKEKTYLIYCRSGNRSSQACAFMSSLGFTGLCNLQGGIGAWNATVGAY